MFSSSHLTSSHLFVASSALFMADTSIDLHCFIPLLVILLPTSMNISSGTLRSIFLWLQVKDIGVPIVRSSMSRRELLKWTQNRQKDIQDAYNDTGSFCVSGVYVSGFCLRVCVCVNHLISCKTSRFLTLSFTTICRGHAAIMQAHANEAMHDGGSRG